MCFRLCTDGPINHSLSVCSIIVPCLAWWVCLFPHSERCSSRWCYDQPVHHVTSPFWLQGNLRRTSRFPLQFDHSQHLPFHFLLCLRAFARTWPSSSHLRCQPPLRLHPTSPSFTLPLLPAPLPIYRLNSFTLCSSLPVLLSISLPLFPDSLIWFTTVGALCHRRVLPVSEG